MFDAKISPPLPELKRPRDPTVAVIFCRGRLVEVSAHEEKQALLYRQPHLRGVREICGIGDITG
jgi:hypothetical protein